MKRLALIALALAAPAAAQDEPTTPASVVAAAGRDEWVAIAPQDLLVMDLAPDTAGRTRRVVIQLMPPPFSQPWVENIRTLARAHWWDGTSVYRVVDNWVAQWGGGEGDGFAVRALPAGVASPVASYEVNEEALAALPANHTRGAGEADAMLSISTTQTRLTEEGWHDRDSSAPWVEFVHGWPIANLPELRFYDDNGKEVRDPGRRRPGRERNGPPYREIVSTTFWPVHCYAHVGVARDLAPDTGTGAELYAVIGHAPRQLDRNIAVVGRVIAGIEHLSTLPRGTGEAGVYETRAEDTAIVSVRLASELPDPPAYEYLSTDSPSFARYVAVRANRQDSFYTVPAGGVDICNVQVPIRMATP